MVSKFLAAAIISFSVFAIGSVSHAANVADEPLTERQMIDLDGVPETLLDDQVESLASPSDPNLSAADETKILAKYSYLDPQKLIPEKLLKTAVIYYESNYAYFSNHSYLAVVDYSPRSTKERFFVVDLKSGEVMAMHTAHGKGSDSSAHNGYADKFSTAGGSNMSSLGFAKTDAKTYVSKSHYNTHALRLIGLSKTNSSIYKRAVVIHAAKYVFDEDVVQGRSLGCPALSLNNIEEVTSMLQGGALMYFGLSAK